MIRILVVDAQKVIREQLKQSLNSQADLEVVGLAENGQIALELVNALQPDVVLLDMEMPGMDGADITRAILQQFQDPKVIVLTSSTEDVHIAAVLEAGAHGYLLKNTPVDELVNAIYAAQKGYTQLSPGLLNKVQVKAPSSVPNSSQGKIGDEAPPFLRSIAGQGDDLENFLESDRLYTNDFIRENEHASRLLLFSVICAGLLTFALAIGYFLFQQGQQSEQPPEPLNVPELPPPEPQFTAPPSDRLPEQNQGQSEINPTLPLPPPLDGSPNSQTNSPTNSPPQSPLETDAGPQTNPLPNQFPSQLRPENPTPSPSLPIQEPTPSSDANPETPN